METIFWYRANEIDNLYKCDKNQLMRLVIITSNDCRITSRDLGFFTRFVKNQCNKIAYRGIYSIALQFVIEGRNALPYLTVLII